MKTRYIYYLPNAVRDYGNGKILYGKIGCTDNYRKRVVFGKSETPRFGKLDITGHHVLETIYATKEEAESIEKIWQNNFILLDGPSLPRTDIAKQNMSIAKKGKKRGPQSQEQIDKIAAAKFKPIIAIDCSTNIQTTYGSLKECANSLGIRNSGISTACKTSKPFKGYKFEYAN